MNKIHLSFVTCTMIFLFGIQLEEQQPLRYLSEYALFEGIIADLKPAADVVPYDLNMPLFSDYAWKARFLRLPEGTAATWHDTEIFDFPVGTQLIKTFYYPHDFNHPEAERIILETRLLIKEPKGWKAYTYVWNDDQTDAIYEPAGDSKPVSWKDKNGQLRQLQYQIPNLNECKGCHSRENKILPVGPSARQLNRAFQYRSGAENQLSKWAKAGLLTNLLEDNEKWPSLPQWDGLTALDGNNLDALARAYLDINCGSCHHPYGAANTSGLFLHQYEQNKSALGIMKSPVAAGRGVGKLKFNVVPGKPNASILLFRMQSDDSGIRMPELGRTLPHHEGIDLIKTWITQLGTGKG